MSQHICCERSFLGLMPVRIDSGRDLVEDEDLFGSGPHLLLGLFNLNSRMSPERVRSQPGLAGSEEIHLVVMRRSKCFSRHNSGLLLISVPRNCSVVVPDFEVRFTSMSAFVILHHFSLVSAVESLWTLAYLNFPRMSPEVDVCQQMGLVGYCFGGLLSVNHSSGVK